MSEMGREIREGMKKVIREKGFGYWFKSVFLYHYGKLALGLIIAAAVAVYITAEGMKEPDFDFSVIIGTNAEIGYTQTQELEDIIAAAVGDINGDGEVHVNLRVDGANIQLWLSQPEFALCLMSDYYSRIYGENDFFDNVENYGFAPDGAHPYRTDISSSPVIARLAELTGSEEAPVYACLCDWTTVGKGKPEWTQAALRALSAIIEAQ